MKRRLLLPLVLMLCLPLWAQQVQVLRQRSLSHYGIGTGNLSGIAPLGENRYAVVSDKEPTDGFFTLTILLDSVSGRVSDVRLEGFAGNALPKTDAALRSVRDCEGVAFFPPAETLFISGEGDQQILEYTFDGQPTGRSLNIPDIFSAGRIVPNLGFEALTYDSFTESLWTTTESTLPADGPCACIRHGGVQNLLRLQRFDATLQPAAQFAYRMDLPAVQKYGKLYAFGVPALCALPDGRLLVLEREVNIKKNYLGSTVRCKLFLVNPAQGWPIDSSVPLSTLNPNHFLVKQLLADFTTRLSPFSPGLANYEGMCLGPRLADGRQTLLLLNDSQGGMGNSLYRLRDYIKVLVLSLP